MKNDIVRSPLFYVGDKYKLIKSIKPCFPKNINRYIEPLTGGGSTFLNVSAREYLLNDINEMVYKLHLFLINHADEPELFFNRVNSIIEKYNLSRSYKEDIVPIELKKKYLKTYYAKFNKDGFAKLRSNFNREDKTDLYKFYVLLIYGFNRMIRFNQSGDYNLPVGNVDFNTNVVNALNNYFDRVQNRNISWYNLDYVKFIEKVSPQKGDFIYFDPPYLLTFSEYNKLWNEEKEEELIEMLDELNRKSVKFAVSNVVLYKNNENKIFNNWSKKYNVIPIKSNYISYHDNSIKKFKEVLVINYEPETKTV